VTDQAIVSVEAVLIATEVVTLEEDPAPKPRLRISRSTRGKIKEEGSRHNLRGSLRRVEQAMSQVTKQATCPEHGSVLAVANKPSHLFHLVMTILTVGLWLFVWLWASTQPYRCPICGRRVG
jgi:hypothetical protein